MPDLAEREALAPVFGAALAQVEDLTADYEASVERAGRLRQRSALDLERICSGQDRVGVEAALLDAKIRLRALAVRLDALEYGREVDDRFRLDVF